MAKKPHEDTRLAKFLKNRILLADRPDEFPGLQSLQIKRHAHAVMPEDDECFNYFIAAGYKPV